MALIDELKEKREVWLCNVALHDQRVVDECLNAMRAKEMVADLDRAIAALEPVAELFEDEKVEAREQLETDHALPPSADDVVAEPVETLAQPEWNEPTEGYAPVTNPDADFWARGLTSEQKPQSYNPFSIFRREKEEA
jgi:hypothetical protein